MNEDCEVDEEQLLNVDVGGVKPHGIDDIQMD